jgi:hypothetical protein
MLWHNLAFTFTGETVSEHFNVDPYPVYSILKVEKKGLRESLPPARLTQQRDYLQ